MTSLKEFFKNRFRPSKVWLVVMGFAFLVFCFAIMFTIYQYQTGSEIGGKVETEPAQKDVETTPGGDSTQKFNEMLEKKNKQQAKQAEEKGESFLPTVVGNQSRGGLEQEEKDKQRSETKKSNRDETDTSQPSSKEIALQNRIEKLKRQMRELKQANKRRQRQLNREQSSRETAKTRETGKRYQDQIKQVSQELNLQRTEQEVQNFDNKGIKGTAAKTKKTATNGDSDIQSNPKEDSQESGLELSAGDILYAKNELKLNSDSPSPAQATVVNGKYKGAKLLGGFKRQGGYLRIQFNRLILPSGEEHQIEGFAINPEVPSAAVRSDVDNHMLQRWGGLMAASFLSGFGEAISQSDSTISVSDGQTTKAYPEMDTRKQLWSAGGKVGEKLAQKFDSRFNMPPTVTLAPGENIGVLIISSE